MSAAIPATTRAAVLTKINEIVLEDRPVQQPGEHDVLIAIKSVGICGSDVHYWTHGEIGPFVLKAPMILGHESAGQVVGVGSKVKTLKVGDRVTIEPGYPCRRCNHCRVGRYNLCAEMVFCATPPYDGSLSNYIVHPADFCFKLPDHVTYDEAALCEPLSVGVHATSRAQIQVGHNVLITGAGPIGLVSLLAAKGSGAGHVIVTDVRPERLAVAKEMGADFVIDVSKLSEAEVLQQLSVLVDNIDATIECSGAAPSICLGIKATRSGGVVVLVGLGAAEVKIPLVDAAVREVDIRGVFRYANSYPKALALIASGKLNVKPLITHHYKLEQVIEAFTVAKDGKDKDNKMAIKVMFNL